MDLFTLIADSPSFNYYTQTPVLAIIDLNLI